MARGVFGRFLLVLMEGFGGRVGRSLRNYFWSGFSAASERTEIIYFHCFSMVFRA